jgi:hypothetical protein
MVLGIVFGSRKGGFTEELGIGNVGHLTVD